jgi:hypothetical protein
MEKEGLALDARFGPKVPVPFFPVVCRPLLRLLLIKLKIENTKRSVTESPFFSLKEKLWG